jgi:arylsulfatase
LTRITVSHFGKNHETAAWEVSPSGPTDRWPTRQGFDKFYGFFGGETNQWAPLVYDGLTPVELPSDPKYNFMTDMANKAIEWVSFQQALTPNKPFFLYFAPGATHAPHHVPKEWITKYRGKFDQGWDKLREETLARQIRLGVVPKGTQLAPKPSDVKDWAVLSADEKRLAARQMEVFAAFSEYADFEIGRLIDALREQGKLDNTLVFYILGDNGTSAEGGPNGVFNELSSLNLVPETVEQMLKHYDNWGDPSTYPHMAYGWAIAGNTPFSWAKQIASYFGGTRNGMVVHWPRGVQRRGEIRSQFSHVIDIVPTILDAARLPEPRTVNGIAQIPIQGRTLAPTFNDPKAPTRTTQYFEIIGNRAMYHDGWYARIVHSAPWSAKPFAPLQAEQWELFDARTDFSLVTNVAAKYSDKVRELNELFMREASANHALPIDDRRFERLNAGLVGRPDLMAGRTSLTLYPGMHDMGENVFINVKNTSSTITTEVEIPAGGGNGVILAQGGRFGGYSLYLKNGMPRYTYNFVGLKRTTIGSEEGLPPGNYTIRYEFAYDGGGVGKGGTGTLFVNGKQVAQGRVETTTPFIFSLDESADVGSDRGTPVIEEYGMPKGGFDGTIKKVVIEVQPQTPAPSKGAAVPR